MERKQSLALIASAAMAASLTACGSSGGGGNSDPDDTSNASYQEDFSNTDRYDVVTDNSLSIDSSTLAVSPSSATTTGTYNTVKDAADNDVDLGDYFGAVDPNGSNWWDGWTIRDADIDGNLPGSPETFHPLEAEVNDTTITPAGSHNCSNIADGLTAFGTADVFGQSFPVCAIQDGDLDGDHTLPNDHVYLLDGTVQVGNGDGENAHEGGSTSVREDVLTIEKGTQIMGVSDTDPSLVITRGSKIEANGTAAQPIVFGAVETGTSSVSGDVTDLSGRGDWGSVVIAGYGEVNNGDSDNQTQTEAVPSDKTRWFGGTDNADDSGTFEYVVIAESGEAFRTDEEVQGLTLEGVGSGTDIHHVQVTNSDDDGVEWFGGAVDVSNLVIQGVTDDSLDIDLGYQGVIQNALIRQGDSHGDRGIESDNNGTTFGKTPKTSPVIANVTILGDSGNEGATKGALHREGFGGQVYRAVYSDLDAINSLSGQFGLGCLDVDDEVDDTLEYGDVIFNCAAGNLEPADD